MAVWNFTHTPAQHAQRCHTYEYIAKLWTSETGRFIVNPFHEVPGLGSKLNQRLEAAAFS
jgi:hypothetical protein